MLINLVEDTLHLLQSVLPLRCTSRLVCPFGLLCAVPFREYKEIFLQMHRLPVNIKLHISIGLL